MNSSTRSVRALKVSLFKRFLILIPLLVVLVVGSYLYIRPKVDTYTVHTLYAFDDAEFAVGEVTLSDPSVVDVESIDRGDSGSVRIRFDARTDGETDVTYASGSKSQYWQIEVRDGAVLENGINFEGWEAVQISLLVFLIALCLVLVSCIYSLWRASWYGYTMVACGGALLFFLFQVVFFTALLVKGSCPSLDFYLWDVARMAEWFAILSIYLMLPLALAVSISNVSLIRHEGKRPINMLGVAASVVWAVVYYILFFEPYGTMPHGVVRMFYELLPVAIAYGECLLLSTVLCAWLAKRHAPSHDVDYLVILGCGIRADGTPTPLLAGRVDRAVNFADERVAAGGKPAVFVPSGGQGPNECISEAQSMAQYLVKQKGIAPERIVLEDRSTDTRENMAFSREVIERHAGCDASELRVGFSTTNYHVLRGYVCAHRAGMSIEGMGAKTKWYFWPNAFLREFVGLLVRRWEDVLIFFLLVSGSYLFALHVLELAGA